jgi:hypothetical protein
LLLAEPELIRQQCEVLRCSNFSDPELDACFALHCELVSLGAEAQKALFGTRDRMDLVQQFSDRLDSWWETWNSSQDSPFHTKE